MATFGQAENWPGRPPRPGAGPPLPCKLPTVPFCRQRRRPSRPARWHWSSPSPSLNLQKLAPRPGRRRRGTSRSRPAPPHLLPASPHRRLQGPSPNARIYARYLCGVPAARREHWRRGRLVLVRLKLGRTSSHPAPTPVTGVACLPVPLAVSVGAVATPLAIGRGRPPSPPPRKRGARPARPAPVNVTVTPEHRVVSPHSRTVLPCSAVPKRPCWTHCGSAGVPAVAVHNCPSTSR